MLRRPPFITGSRAYGIPRPDSDIDLVMLVNDDGTVSRLHTHSDTQLGIRYGKLNLIMVQSAEEYDAWKAAHDECCRTDLVRNGKYDKAKAIAIHDKHIRPLGLPDNYNTANPSDADILTEKLTQR